MTFIRSDAIYAPPKSIVGTTIPDSKLAREVTELVKRRPRYWPWGSIPKHPFGISKMLG
jgi:hypothetical protein